MLYSVKLVFSKPNIRFLLYDKLLVLFCATCLSIAPFLSFSFSAFTTLALLLINFFDHIHQEQIKSLFGLFSAVALKWALY